MSDKLPSEGRSPNWLCQHTCRTSEVVSIGAGAETLITEHITLRGEYRFTDFGSGQLGLPNIYGNDLNDFVIAHAAPTMQDTRVSVNYRF